MNNSELFDAIAFAYDALLRSDSYTGARELISYQLKELLRVQLERAREKHP